MYGLDFSEVRYETDHAGNRLTAKIPYPMFSALTEFWIAARRAATARVEAGARPGQYKGSLQAAQVPQTDAPSPTPAAANKPAPLNTHDRHWQNLLDRLPADEAAPAVATPPAPVAAPVAEAAAQQPEAATTPRKQQRPRPFFREFVEAPPVEVQERISRGVYFTRAWREYRGLTLNDAAELFGRDKTTIIWHEKGKSKPTGATLAKLAHIYDCPVAQMTPKPGSDDSSFKGQHAEKVAKEQAPAEAKRRSVSEPRSPAGTEYPDAVLAHLKAGKSPVLAWRLYRGLSIKALAEQYGTTTGNLKQMEDNAWLRPKSIAKLAPILKCKPEQMLRPDALEDDAPAQPVAVVAPDPVKKKAKSAEPVAPAASVMESAFQQAKEQPHREPRKRNDHLAKMQAEMSRL
ncbi:helix-turn-helix domain-containing protein [Paraburkholderia silvatlantica]|uniref:helix-turn-helix domain-containing protein n=1 Tax=Paraburkholderia silvatlantica TaxID=321895 RepID=UPI0037527837